VHIDWIPDLARLGGLVRNDGFGGVLERKVNSHMKSKKKEYKKPEVKRVSLDAKCAVLAFCKDWGSLGPDGADCGMPVPPCAGPGS
jgi:hypothetical protein